MLRSLTTWSAGRSSLSRLSQLRVAILLNDVDALVRGDKVVNLVREGVGADAHVVDVLRVFLFDLVEAFAEGKVGAAEGEEADL